MKILLVADLHYALPQFDWLLGAAPAYDVVVIAGDLLDTSATVDPGTQTIVVLSYLKRLKTMTRLLVCSGNHDLDRPGSSGEMQASWIGELRRLGIAADGETLSIGDTMFTCCPWWDGPETLKSVSAQLAAAAPQRHGPWIWIYHAPPASSPVSWNGRRHYGDQALLGWIVEYQPDFVLSGHVHEAPFARDGSWTDRMGRTWLFNAGKQIGPVPTTISIDTDAGEAAWLSMEGGEAVELAGPLKRPIPPLDRLPAWLPR